MALSFDDFENLGKTADSENLPGTGEDSFLDELEALSQTNTPLAGKHAKFVSGQAAMIASGGVTSDEVNRVLLGGEPTAERVAATEEHYQQQRNDVLDYVNSELSISQIDPLGISSVALAETQRVQARATDPAAAEMAYVEQAAPKAPGTVKDELAFQMKARNLLAEVADSQGWYDDALDLAGMVIPFALTKDMSDAADMLSKDPELAAIAGPDLEAIALNFQALDPATKEKIFPRLVEVITEATKTSLFGVESSGNLTQAVGVLSAFLGSNAGDVLAGNRAIDIGLSAMDVPVGKLVKGAATIGKLSTAERVAAGRVLKETARDAVQRNNPINVAKQAGDEEAAVVHAKAAMMDAEVAEAMNTTPLDAALSAMPVQTSTWYPQVTGDLAAAMAKQLDTDMQRAQGFVRSLTTERELLNVGAIKESDRKNVMEGFMKRMERKGEDYLTQNLQMESLKIVDEGVDGFTYEYVLRRTDIPTAISQADNVTRDLQGVGSPALDIKMGADLTWEHAYGNVSRQLVTGVPAPQDAGKVGVSSTGERTLPGFYTLQGEVLLKDGTTVGVNKVSGAVMDANGNVIDVSAISAFKNTGGGWVHVEGAAMPKAVVDNTPVQQQVVANVNIVKTKAGSTRIKGDPKLIQKALTDAGLPPGAVNKVKGEYYISLSGELYEDATKALAKSSGIELGAPTSTASQRVKARAADARAAYEGTTPEVAGQLNEASVPQYQKIQGKVKFTLDIDTGTYNATADALEQNIARSYVQAQTSWSKGTANFDFNEAVTDSIVASDVGAAAQKFADDFLQWTVDPLKGVKGVAARKRLDAVLLYGDTYINEGTAIRGRTFTPQELADGFDIPGHSGKVRLTSPAEVTAYYRARMFADAMYQVENHAMRRRLELEGVREVKVGNDLVLGKSYDDINAARLALSDKPGYVIFKADSREILDIDLDALARDYEQGYKLVKTRKTYNTSGGGVGDEVSAHADFILVKEHNIRDLPAQVLHYKPGYVPKVNKIEFMLKKEYAINKPGEPGARGSMALRGFNSLQDALSFRDEMVAKDIAANPHLTYEQAAQKYSIGGADSVSGIDAIENGLGASGGLYTGARSQNDILFGLSGSDMRRVGALEALQRQTAHVGVLVSRNEMRLIQEQRWLNTVRDRLPSTRITGFESTALPPSEIGRALERMRQQIKEWNGIPEVQETRFQAAVQYLHDWVVVGKRGLGFQAEGSWESLQYLKHKNPVTAVKAAVMHTLLGALNPAQLYTQASAAIIAGSRRAGVSLTGDVAGDLRAAFLFGFMDNIRDETAFGKMIEKMIAGKQLDPVVADAYRAYRRTGLYESALNNADTAKLSVDGLGMTMGMLKKLDTLSLVFYRSGELFNRRYSFIKEFAAWASQNKGKVATEADIIAITKEANKDMLELNAANRAWWQGGNGTNSVRQILGMATQFLQVTTKTAELLLPNWITGRAEASGFTQAQKGRIFFGQAALFGAAGVPLGNAALNGLFNILGVQDIPPETALALNQGFIGFTVNGMLGNWDNPEQQLDISQRVALGNQMNEFVRSIMTSDDPLIYSMLGPAGGTIGSRFMSALQELRIFYLGSKADSWELSGEDLVGVIHTIGQVTSTGNNLVRAYTMHNFNKILDRRRNTVDARDYDFGTEMAVAFGFRPSIETTTRMIQQAVFKNQELVTELADVRVRLMHRAIFELKMEPAKVDAIDKAIQAMDEMIDNPVISQQVQDEVQRRLFTNPKTTYDKAVSDWWKQVAVDKLSTDYRLDVQLGAGVAEQAITRPFSQIMQEK